MNKLLLILPLITILFSSCSNSDDVDTTKPNIDIVKPVDDDVFHPGDKINFECNFSDDKELASYKVDIHSNSDGHTHSSSVQLKSGNEEGGHPWSFEKSWNFESGLSSAEIKHQEIEIPSTIMHEGTEEEIAPGHYHLGVYCIDKAGNESVTFIEIEIEHIH